MSSKSKERREQEKRAVQRGDMSALDRLQSKVKRRRKNRRARAKAAFKAWPDVENAVTSLSQELLDREGSASSGDSGGEDAVAEEPSCVPQEEASGSASSSSRPWPAASSSLPWPASSSTSTRPLESPVEPEDEGEGEGLKQELDAAVIKDRGRHFRQGVL